MKKKRCYDKFNQLLKEDDYVDVQKKDVHSKFTRRWVASNLMEKKIE
jgi:hypothetical protein